MTDLTTLSDAEIERLIEDATAEQRRRERLALRAIANQRAFFMPARLYSGTR